MFKIWCFLKANIFRTKLVISPTYNSLLLLGLLKLPHGLRRVPVLLFSWEQKQRNIEKLVFPPA